MRFAAIACVLALTSIAHADSERVERKDRGRAVELSWAPTVAGIALIGVGGAMHAAGTQDSVPVIGTGVIGVLFGPMVGHAYADDTWNRGSAAELIALPLGMVGAYCSVQSSSVKGTSSGGNCSTWFTDATLYGAIGLFTAGVGYQLFTAGAAASEYNRAHHLDGQLTFAPIRTTTGVAPGIGFVGRF